MKIVVGGQMDKQTIAKLIEQTAKDSIDVQVTSDMEAAIAVQTGAAKYYVGACATGAGAALAMAIGLLGGQNCISLSIPGSIKSDEEIVAAVEAGKQAFGFVNTDAERIVPVLIHAILEKENR